jgi:phosphate/sulfate permease
MIIIVFWIGLAYVVGLVGEKKTIGFTNTFLISLFFSPLIGLLVTIAYPSIQTIKFQKKMVRQQSLMNQQTGLKFEYYKELSTLEVQYETGQISKEEFEERSRILETALGKTHLDDSEPNEEAPVFKPKSKYDKYAYWAVAIFVLLFLLYLNWISE